MNAQTETYILMRTNVGTFCTRLAQRRPMGGGACFSVLLQSLRALRWVVPMEFMSTKRSRAPVDGRRGERGKSPVSVGFLLSKRFADADRQKECARSGKSASSKVNELF